MRTSKKFIRKNQRVLAVSLLLASLYSCRKDVMEPAAEITADNTMNNRVSTESITSLLYKENADGTWFNNSYAKLQAAASYSITASTSQFYNGTKSVRFELRDTDPEVQSGTRSEITLPVSTNNNRWYSFAVYFPSADYKFDERDELITQWHQGGGVSPSLCIRVASDRMNMKVLSTPAIDLGAIDKDKWHTYVIHVKHTAGSDGLIEMWRDGVKILNRTGANAYPLTGDFHLPYWKFGIYKSYWNGTRTSSANKRVIYFDDVKMGNEYATYNDMVPVPNATVTTTTPPTTTTTTPAQSIVSFKLVDAATEKDVLTITNGQTISLRALKLFKVNIRAVASTTEVGSIKFQLSGKQSKTYTDNKAPFALHGDDENGNFYYGNWNPPALGTYTLKATPYTSDNASGTAGTSQTITFTIAK